MNSAGSMPRAEAWRSISARSAVVKRGLKRSSRFSSGAFLGRAIHAARLFFGPPAGPGSVQRGACPLFGQTALAPVFAYQKHIWLPALSLQCSRLKFPELNAPGGEKSRVLGPLAEQPPEQAGTGL